MYSDIDKSILAKAQQDRANMVKAFFVRLFSRKPHGLAHA